jgi:TorA maturation chaperone TorD
MQEESRLFIYEFLSTIFSDVMNQKLISQLRNNEELLKMISLDAFLLFKKTPNDELKKLLNIDFTSLFFMNSMPIESFVLEDKDEVQVGLQNPVMQLYFNHGYELDMINSKVNAPDHIAIECAFMQNLIENNEKKVQIKFLENHLLKWAPIYFLGIKDMAKSSFYRDLCDFVAEFFIADYDYLTDLTH